MSIYVGQALVYTHGSYLDVQQYPAHGTCILNPYVWTRFAHMSTEAHHECIYPHRKCQYLVSLHSFSEMKILLIKVTIILKKEVDKL